MTLKEHIKKTVQRAGNRGLTVGEIFDRVTDKVGSSYDSVRGRTYELANAGELRKSGARNDSVTGASATIFTSKR
jgi:hypothetical protein